MDHALQAIELLCRYGFDDDSLETSRAALKCLANVLLLQSDTRQMFVDLGYASKAAERMKVKQIPKRVAEFQCLIASQSTEQRPGG